MDVLKLILKSPKSKYTDYYKQANYIITWRMMLFVTAGLFPITLAYFFVDNNAFYPSLYGLCTSSILLYWFYVKRDYKFVGSVFAIHSVLFLGVEMLITDNTLHLIEFPWFFVFSIYALLIIGRKIGVMVVSVSFIFVFVYSLFFFEDNFNSVISEITTTQMIGVVLNIMLGFVILILVILSFKSTRYYAEQKYQLANSSLTEKNKLIEAQNEEKTIMLKEIHHRVKNNLQVISSLVRLQSHEIEDKKAKTMFDATVNRVLAMALIHEKMYQKDNLSKINLEDYVKSLAIDIFNSFSYHDHVDFQVKSDFEIIGNRTIVPLALILNELITNSLKHAFEKVDKKQILISIKTFDNEFFVLSYKDTGVWKTTSKPSSFGLELIETFIDQLDGSLDREISETGTKYTLKLKNIE